MNKLGEYISYDDKFFESAWAFIMRYKLLGIDLTCELLEKLKTNDQLENIFSAYLSLEPEDNTEIIIPKQMDIKEIVDIANEILISIFPQYKNEILGYDDLIYIYEELSFYEACYNYQLSDDNKIIPISIDISDNFSEITVGSLNHEKVHVLVFEKLNQNQFPGIYIELFSMFFQKVSDHLLERKINSKQTTIIDNIIHTIDNQRHVSALDNLREIKLYSESINNCIVYQYLNLKANDYLLSNWYSEMLFRYYLIDSQGVIKNINRVFKQEITIQELLNYYQINLENNELFSCIEERLNETKKYTIKL